MPLIAVANWVGWVLAAIGGLAVWFWQARHPFVLSGRRAVILFSAVWTAVLLLEFYALGPASYIAWNVDGNMGPPFYAYLMDRHLGGQFVHGYGGGHDVDAAVGFGTQVFSLEGALFSLLPVWLAVVVLKIGVTAVGFSGIYKLGRAGAGFGRTLAAGLAALFTLTLFYHIDAATWHGLGYSVLPWMVYLGVVRDGKRYYLPGLVALGLITSVAEPTHTFLAIVSTLVAGAVALGRVTLRTIILPLAMVGVFMVANWHEIFFAFTLIAPLTFRGTLNLGDQDLIEAIRQALFLFPTLKLINLGSVIAAVGLVASMTVLARREAPFFRHAMGAFVFLIAFYVALVWLPWEIVGLGLLKGLTPEYLFFANSVLFLLVAGKAVTSMEAAGGGGSAAGLSEQRWPTALLLTFVAVLLIAHKVENLTRYAYYGGQSQYSTIENLADPTWALPEPFRVVTLRHQRPEPEIAAGFYGLDTYDGILKLPPKAFTVYWRDGILKGKGIEGILSRLTLERKYFTGPAYDVGDQADLSLLGVANVAFLISPIPMKGDVRLVSGPDSPPARRGDGLMTFAAKRLSKIIRFGKVYVYTLPHFLPRAFAARAVHRVDADVTDMAFLKTISDLAPSRTAVVRGTADTLTSAGTLETMRVTDLAKTQGGYDVALDAPDGGVLILNVPPMPFWTAATGAGEPLTVSPVNMIHMAVRVPVGVRSVSFRYRRPTLRSLVRELLQ